MTFKEKSALVMLVVLAVVYGGYFAIVTWWAVDTPVAEVEYQPLLLAAVVALVVLAAGLHLSIVAAAPREADQSDERDRLIELRGDRVGSFVLGAGAVVALGLAMLEIEWFWIAQVILGGLVLAEMAKAAAMLIDYRRGV